MREDTEKILRKIGHLKDEINFLKAQIGGMQEIIFPPKIKSSKTKMKMQ